MSCHFDEVNLLLIIGPTVTMQDVMLPWLGLRRADWGPPMEIGLGAAGDEAPVPATDLAVAKELQQAREVIACLTTQPFSAEHRPARGRANPKLLFDTGNAIITMKRHDV